MRESKKAVVIAVTTTFIKILQIGTSKYLYYII